MLTSLGLAALVSTPAVGEEGPSAGRAASSQGSRPTPVERIPGLDPQDGVALPPDWVESGRLSGSAEDSSSSPADAEAPRRAETSDDPTSNDRSPFLGADNASDVAPPRSSAAPPSVLVSGYIDFGFFATQGDGSGYVQDYGHLAHPELAGYGWVFLGDILSPAVNSRGEVADLGSAPGVTRFDGLHTRGAPSFALNELTLRLRAAPAPNAILSASVNFTPRTGSDFALGDSVDFDIAQLEWLPTASQKTSIFVGKIESVLGIEYRDRKSDARFGITPSLIARYTTGTALGLKVRSKLGEGDWLVLAAALTNGSNTTEQFHFYDEIDSNLGKTVSGRVAVHPHFGDAADLEVGVSGSYWAQDRVTSNRDAMWFFGPDLLLRTAGADVKAAWLRGGAPGDEAQNAYHLHLTGGGYLEVDAFVTGRLGVLGRAEYRDAFVSLGSERAYLTKSWRATLGLRWSLGTWAVLKAEALHNGEWGPGPHVRNDVFTTSLVLSY